MSCLNDQATLLEYNTLKGVYQIATKRILHFFRSNERPLTSNFKIISPYFNNLDDFKNKDVLSCKISAS